MKKRKIEALEAKTTEQFGWYITKQIVDDSILVLNIFKDRFLQARHCINVDTGEYATLKGTTWSTTKIERALGLSDVDARYYGYNYSELSNRGHMSEEDEQYIKDAIQLNYHCLRRTAIQIVSAKETEYSKDKRDIVENNRVTRVNQMMAKVPDIPMGIKEWINQRELKGLDYMLKDKETGLWTCSSCGTEIKETELSQKPRNNDTVICPKCHKAVQFLTRKRSLYVNTHFVLVQPIDDAVSVCRHFRAELVCLPKTKKQIGITEEVRIMLFKDPKGFSKHNLFSEKSICGIYYEQNCYPAYAPDGGHYDGDFDNKSNPANKTEWPGYLYDGGIEEAFQNTAYEKWSRLFVQMAAAGTKANYNRMMIAQDDDNLIRVMELLFKGRYTRLLAEESNNISCWTKAYCGSLRLYGNNIEDVFSIGDRQKINRIRDNNGGTAMLEWMRWSDLNREKVSDKSLEWLLSNGICTNDMAWMKCRFTVEQAMNYIERQRREQYKDKTVKQVIGQYEDYMNMCEKLHKDTRDEMVYRPRELKRRHDEAVAEIERQRAQLVADEYSKRFSEAEKVLKEIKDKYEYSGDKFFIRVPDRIVDIVSEGNYLHHCAGATDRYFDRIKSNETYICFLRKAEDPDTPFYTIEVEPGGTIRQHRGMFDEEPELEQVKPFLREWQKEIRKRMSQKDHELAAASKIKRDANIADLKAKNNTRVLDGLMEDFMEAI